MTNFMTEKEAERRKRARMAYIVELDKQIEVNENLNNAIVNGNMTYIKNAQDRLFRVYNISTVNLGGTYDN